MCVLRETRLFTGSADRWCGVLGPTAFAERNRPSVQTVRSELVFRFNWAALR